MSSFHTDGAINHGFDVTGNSNSNIRVTNPTSGQILVYNASNGLWENQNNTSTASVSVDNLTIDLNGSGTSLQVIKWPKTLTISETNDYGLAITGGSAIDGSVDATVQLSLPQSLKTTAAPTFSAMNVGSLRIEESATSPTSHTLQFPASSSNGYLQNNGSGTLSWTSISSSYCHLYATVSPNLKNPSSTSLNVDYMFEPTGHGYMSSNQTDITINNDVDTQGWGGFNFNVAGVYRITWSARIGVSADTGNQNYLLRMTSTQDQNSIAKYVNTRPNDVYHSMIYNANLGNIYVHHTFVNVYQVTTAPASACIGVTYTPIGTNYSAADFQGRVTSLNTNRIIVERLE